VLAAVLCASIAPAVIGQPMLDRGVQELALHISPDFESAIGDSLFAEAGYGLFVRDRIEGRVTFSYRVMEDIAQEDPDYRMWEANLAGEYHFNFGSRFVPYAGGGVGWTRSVFNRLDESGFTYGPRGGVKYFIADNVCLSADAAFKLSSADVFINDFEAESTDLTASIGLRVLF
jgi:opacity protein-like surface antigen